jgi:hypothetical protein
MASVYLLDNPTQPLILSVDDSVGRGGANRRLDVMLVQFFLNVTAQADEKSWAWLVDRKITKPNIDGICGPITQDWIDRFQAFIRKRARLVVDGRVDPILNGLAETSQHTIFTIYALNAVYYGTFGTNAIARAWNHPLMPRELARTFTTHTLGDAFW